jgi:hypothetical protein
MPSQGAGAPRRPGNRHRRRGRRLARRCWQRRLPVAAGGLAWLGAASLCASSFPAVWPTPLRWPRWRAAWLPSMAAMTWPASRNCGGIRESPLPPDPGTDCRMRLNEALLYVALQRAGRLQRAVPLRPGSAGRDAIGEAHRTHPFTARSKERRAGLLPPVGSFRPVLPDRCRIPGRRCLPGFPARGSGSCRYSSEANRES